MKGSYSDISLENGINSRSYFYFERIEKSDIKPTPATLQLINECKKRNIVPKGVLDLGCGNGRNSYSLAKEFGCKITLVDESSKFLNLATNKLKKCGYEVKETKLARIQNLNLKEFDPADIILCNYVLQNIHPRFYEKVLSLIYHLTKQFFVLEIYQNPALYTLGTFTYRGSTGWYGFHIDEVWGIIDSGFQVTWKNRSSAWRGGSSTLGYILTPKEAFNHHFYNEFNRAISIRKVDPRNRSGRGIHTIPRRRKFEFQSLYPPCMRCTAHECKRYKCDILKDWVYSITNDQQELNSSKYRHLSSSFERTYPPCKSCSIETCRGKTCENIKSWIRNIETRTEKRKFSSKNLETLNPGLPSKYLELIDAAIQLESDRGSYFKEISKPLQVYLVSRLEEIPISLTEICQIYKITKKRLFEELTEIKKTRSIRLTPIDYSRYLRRFVESLPLTSKNRLLIDRISSYLENNKCLAQRVNNGSALVTAGGIIYFSVQNTEKSVSLTYLSSSCHLSSAAIRDKARVLERELSGKIL